MASTLLVTRPQPEADAWVERLNQHGLAACALPLIEIRGVTDPAQLAAMRAAWQDLASDSPDVQAVMFVSAAAVRHFFQLAPVDLPALAQVRAWATGQGTVQALRAAGVPEAQIDAPDEQAAQWDSEALWQRVAPGLAALRAVLIVRGANSAGEMQGRDWLSTQLHKAGVSVRQLAAYARHVPVWDAQQRALAHSDAGLWLFTSSEAVANLSTLMPAHSFGAATAIVTHPRIAKAARDAGFAQVHETAPGLDQLIASVKSLA